MAVHGQALKDAENAVRLEVLLATANNGIIIFDEAGLVEVFSPASEYLFGYSAGEIIGESIAKLIPSVFRNTRPGGVPLQSSDIKPIVGATCEFSAQRKDGTSFPAYLTVGEGKFGKESIYVGIIHDITDENASKQSRSDQDARLNSILNTAPEAIILVDEKGRIEFFSPGAMRLFGYEQDEIIHQQINDLIISPDGESQDVNLRQFLNDSSKGIISECHLVDGKRKDSSIFSMEICVGEIRVGGSLRFTCFIRDMTEMHGMQSRLADLQVELLRMSRMMAMGQMASALSHELNQPLSAVMNYVNAAHQMISEVDNPKVRVALEYIEKAIVQTSRTGQIIKHMRDYIEKGQSSRAYESLNNTIEEGIAVGLVGLMASHVEIEFAFDPDLPPVFIDKIQVEQVIVNLVRNSIEAMQDIPDPRLKISTTVAGGKYAVVTISDNGPGLAKEVVENLFTPFTTTKAEGMGMGLAICRSIMQSHEGTISAVSGTEGSSFSLQLPILQEPESSHEGGSAPLLQALLLSKEAPAARKTKTRKS